MKIYRVYYRYNTCEHWLYVKATTKQDVENIFKSNMNPETKIIFISEAKEHQIARSDITLNFTIDFEKDYVCGWMTNLKPLEAERRGSKMNRNEMISVMNHALQFIPEENEVYDYLEDVIN